MRAMHTLAHEYARHAPFLHTPSLSCSADALFPLLCFLLHAGRPCDNLIAQIPRDPGFLSTMSKPAVPTPAEKRSLVDEVLGAFRHVPPSKTLDHVGRFLSTWSGTDKVCPPTYPSR